MGWLGGDSPVDFLSYSTDHRGSVRIFDRKSIEQASIDCLLATVSEDRKSGFLDISLAKVVNSFDGDGLPQIAKAPLVTSQPQLLTCIRAFEKFLPLK